MPGQTDGVISGVKVILVAVDDNLYSPTCGIPAAIDANIEAYLSKHMGCAPADAPAARARYAAAGSALAGLLLEADARFDADLFVTEVYESLDYSAIKKDKKVAQILENMRGGGGARRVWLYSSAHKEHVLSVLAALAVPAGAYDGIVEARGLGYKLMPSETSFSLAMRAVGDCQRREVLLVDHCWENVEAARGFGMQAVHVSNSAEPLCDASGCLDYQMIVSSPRNSKVAQSCMQTFAHITQCYPDLFS
jgi:pyrimidine 5'-nucleotidase